MRTIPWLLASGILLGPTFGAAENPPEILTSLQITQLEYLTWDGAASIYYTDANLVHKLSTELWEERTWQYPICFPFGVAANGAFVYVSNVGWPPEKICSPDNIAKFSTDGTFINSWSHGVYPDTCCYAGTLALDRRGRLYAGGGKLRLYDGSGQLLSEHDSNNENFSGLAVGLDGYLYATESQNRHAVLRFNPDLTGFEVFIPHGTSDGSVSGPGGLAFGPDGVLYVVDRGRHQVQRFDKHGDFLGAWATTAVTTGAVAVDGEGYVYIGTPQAILKYDNHPGPAAVPPHPPAILLHVGKAIGRGVGCDSIPGSPEQVLTKGDVDASGKARYFVYLFASPMTLGGNQGLTGIQVGLQYTSASGNLADAFSLFGWNPCSVLDFPQDGWPASGTGNTITWMADVCQQKEIVLAGYMYLSAYAPGTLSIVGYPATGLAKEAVCGGAELVVDKSQLGWVAFGKANEITGCNPLYQNCANGVTPARPTTWGSLKSRFHSPGN